MDSLESEFNDFKQKYSVLEKVNIKVTVHYCNENTRDGNPGPTKFLDPERIRIRIRNLNFTVGFILILG